MQRSLNLPNGATLDFERQLWATADKLRGHMDAAEYKHVVLGLIFLKYISDAFEERYEQLVAEDRMAPTPRIRTSTPPLAPSGCQRQPAGPHSRPASKPTIGAAVDQAMEAIERENPTLKDVLPKAYARPTLGKTRLGELVDLVSDIGLGAEDHRAQDLLGRVYEYFLSQFASAEGKQGGEFYTPRSVVRVLGEMRTYPSHSYFGLWLSGYVEFKGRLADLMGRAVDLVMGGAMHNRYFIRNVNETRRLLCVARHCGASEQVPQSVAVAVGVLDNSLE